MPLPDGLAAWLINRFPQAPRTKIPPVFQLLTALGRGPPACPNLVQLIWQTVASRPNA